MTDKRFAKNVSIVLGISGVLVLFSFVLVAHHRDVPDQVRQNRHALLGSGSSAAERTKAIGQINVASAETQRPPAQVAAAAPAEVNGQRIYQSTCVACHGAGMAG